MAGKEKSAFDKLLADVMSFRNAFTHGTISSDGERVSLSFFQGRPRKEELSDDFLTKVETTLFTAHNQVFAVEEKVRKAREFREQNREEQPYEPDQTQET